MHDVTVHQTDILLSWFGREPSLVFANQTRKTEAGSVLAATLVFDDGTNGDDPRRLRVGAPAFLADDDGRRARLARRDRRHRDPRARSAADGARVSADRDCTDSRASSVDIPLLYRYAPESFASTMGDLLLAIHHDDEPWASGENVLKTMRTLFAIERSIAERRPGRARLDRRR